MKHYFTLSLVLLWVISAFSQSIAPQPSLPGWDKMPFSEKELILGQVKAVHVKSYLPNQVKKGAFFQGTSYSFSSAGKLTQQVELDYQDTSRVDKFIYTERGVLGWQKTTDKIWNKIYRSGFRFSRNQKVFQVKSYEMLRNDERMLLDTRQYIYGEDSLLSTIKILENRKVVKQHHFQYDPMRRMQLETTLNTSGDTIQQVAYGYDEAGRVIETRILKEGQVRIYQYEYAPNGKPERIEWREPALVADTDGRRASVLKGYVSYVYNPEGMLSRMDRIAEPNSDQASHLVKIFEYERY